MSDNTASTENSQIPVWTLRGKPVPIPEGFEKSIASIVVEWSRFEMGIVADTSSMMQFRIVQELATEAPRAFTKKIALWKKAVDTLFRDVPIYRNMAAQIKTKGVAVSKMRNHIIHGTWNIVGPDENGAWSVSNLRALQFVEYHETVKVDQAKLDYVLAEITDLSNAIYSFQVTKMLHRHLGMMKAVPES